MLDYDDSFLMKHKQDLAGHVPSLWHMRMARHTAEELMTRPNSDVVSWETFVKMRLTKWLIVWFDDGLTTTLVSIMIQSILSIKFKCLESSYKNTYHVTTLFKLGPILHEIIRDLDIALLEEILIHLWNMYGTVILLKSELVFVIQLDDGKRLGFKNPKVIHGFL